MYDILSDRFARIERFSPKNLHNFITFVGEGIGVLTEGALGLGEEWSPAKRPPMGLTLMPIPAVAAHPSRT